MPDSRTSLLGSAQLKTLLSRHNDPIARPRTAPSKRSASKQSFRRDRSLGGGPPQSRNPPSRSFLTRPGPMCLTSAQERIMELSTQLTRKSSLLSRLERRVQDLELERSEMQLECSRLKARCRTRSTAVHRTQAITNSGVKEKTMIADEEDSQNGRLSPIESTLLSSPSESLSSMSARRFKPTFDNVGLTQENNELRRERDQLRARVRQLTHVLRTKASTQMLRVVEPSGRTRTKTVTSESLCSDFEELRELTTSLSDAVTITSALQEERRAMHVIRGSAVRVAHAKRHEERLLRVTQNENRALKHQIELLQEQLEVQTRLVTTQKDHMATHAERQQKIKSAVKLLVAESSPLGGPEHVNFCGLKIRPPSKASDPAFVPTTRGTNDTLFKSALVALIKENESTTKRLRRSEAALVESERQLRIQAGKFETLKRAHRERDERINQQGADSNASQRLAARRVGRRSSVVGSAVSNKLHINEPAIPVFDAEMASSGSTTTAVDKKSECSVRDECNNGAAAAERGFEEATAALEAIRRLPSESNNSEVDSEFTEIVFEDMKGSWKMAAELALQLQHVLAAAYLMTKQNMNVDQACVTIMETAVKACNADRGALFIVDDVKQQLWSKTTLGGVEIRVPLNQGVVGFVVTSGESVHIADAYASGKFDSRIDSVTGYRTRNIIAVPVKDPAGKILGVLQLLNKMVGSKENDQQRRNDPSSFSVVDEMVLGMVARQAGVVLQNINSNAEAESKQNKLRSIFDMIPSLHTDFTPGDESAPARFADKLERGCTKLLGAEKVVMFVCDNEFKTGQSRRVWSRALSHQPDVKMGADFTEEASDLNLDGSLRWYNLTPGSSLVEQVINTGKKVSLRNAYASSVFNGNVDIMDYGHLLCYPLNGPAGEVLGCIQVLLPKSFATDPKMVESGIEECEHMLQLLLSQVCSLVRTMANCQKWIKNATKIAEAEQALTCEDNVSTSETNVRKTEVNLAEKLVGGTDERIQVAKPKPIHETQNKVKAFWGKATSVDDEIDMLVETMGVSLDSTVR